MSLNKVETCSDCKREIGESEQAYVFDGIIVCGECYMKLQNGKNPQVLSSTDLPCKLFTQCPSCQIRYNISDTHIGKKTNCQKCSNDFVITVYDENTEKKMCAECGRRMGRFESSFTYDSKVLCFDCIPQTEKPEVDFHADDSQEDVKEVNNCRNCGTSLTESAEVSVFNGIIVCSDCHKALSNGTEIMVSKKVGSALRSGNLYEESNWLDCSQASKSGIIVSIIFIIFSFLLLFQDSPEPQGRTVRFPKFDSSGSSSGYETINVTMPQSEMGKYGDVSGSLAWLCASLCLFIRSSGISFIASDGMGV